MGTMIEMLLTLLEMLTMLALLTLLALLIPRTAGEGTASASTTSAPACPAPANQQQQQQQRGVCVCVRQIVHISVGRHFGVSSLGYTLANMREELSDKELVKRIRNARFFLASMYVYFAK